MKTFPNPENIGAAEFELMVKSWFEAFADSLESFEVNHLDAIDGTDGEYEFDVTVRFTAFGGMKFLMCCECKKHKNPIKRDVIQVLHAKMRSVGAQKGCVVATAPFQAGAQEYAKSHGIALMEIVSGSMQYIQMNAKQVMPYIPEDADDYVAMFQCKSVGVGLLTVIASSKKTYWLEQFLQFPVGSEYQISD